MEKREQSGLSAKKRAAIIALLSGHNHQEAAAAARVHANTLSEWMRDAVFIGELRQAEGALMDQAARQLLGGQRAAIEELNNLVSGLGGAPPAVRLRAAVALVELSLKLRELRNIEDRLAALESAINDKPQK